MTERVTPQQFEDSAGAAGWRVALPCAVAHFRTGGFPAGAALAAAIADAGAAPDIVLRPAGVTVRLPGTLGVGFTTDHVETARRISAVAAELGATADPTAVQEVQLVIDALDVQIVRAFWRAALGYVEKGDEDLVDPRGHGPSIWFQPMDAPRPQRNRVHLDVMVPPDQAGARVTAALAAGGRLVRDNAPTHWGLADPEGNEVDIATWAGRD